MLIVKYETILPDDIMCQQFIDALCVSNELIVDVNYVIPIDRPRKFLNA